MIIVFIDYDKNKSKGIIKSDWLDNIREHFSEKDDKANLKRRMFKTRFVPDRHYVITPAGRFDIGLLPSIIEFLNTLKAPFKIILSEEFKQIYSTGYNFPDGDKIYELNLKLRDYQEFGVKSALKHGCGLFIYHTGSGKTLLMASTIHNIRMRKPDTKTLVITQTHLVDQTYEAFLSYGIPINDVSKWTGTNPLDIKSSIVICGTHVLYPKIENVELEYKKVRLVHLSTKREIESQTLTGRELEAKRKLFAETVKDMASLETQIQVNKPIHEYFRNIDLLLFDEVHSMKVDNEISKITTFVKSRNRFGYTGTLPESQLDVWNIMGKIGPILVSSDRNQLVVEKSIADVDIRVLKLHYQSEPDYIADSADSPDADVDKSPTANYRKELDFLYQSSFRNKIIQKVVSGLDKNVLIIVERITHGDILLKLLTESIPNKKVYFIQGSVEDEDRNQIKKWMETENNIVCIAISKIFTTGIDIKNLHYILFASANKAKVSTVQAIGRGVRMMAGKTKVVIFDIADILRYGQWHLQKRLNIYGNESLKFKILDIKET